MTLWWQSRFIAHTLNSLQGIHESSSSCSHRLSTNPSQPHSYCCTVLITGCGDHFKPPATWRHNVIHHSKRQWVLLRHIPRCQQRIVFACTYSWSSCNCFIITEANTSEQSNRETRPKLIILIESQFRDLSNSLAHVRFSTSNLTIYFSWCQASWRCDIVYITYRILNNSLCACFFFLQELCVCVCDACNM